ncbi:MAG: pyridoxal phosphate-dependent aminotransferase [Brevinematia bacterium]
MNIDKIKSFMVMDILERTKEMENNGVEIIHLEIGEPDLPTPPEAIEKLNEYLSKYRMSYTHSLGIQTLRESISKYYFEEYKTQVSPSNIVITPGSSIGMQLVISLLLEETGDFITFDPSYPCYPNFIRYFNGNVVKINIFKENNFNPELKDITSSITKRTKGIIFSSPSNPTGVLIKDEIVEELLNRNVPVIVDEIYQGIVFNREKHESSIIKYFSRDGNLIISNGFSKYFAMPGWRIGWLVLPDRFVKNIQKLLQNIVISTPTPSQILANICINEFRKIFENYVKIYKERLEKAKNYLSKFGFSVGYEIEGGFYIFLDLSKYTNNSYELSKKLLEEYLVAVTPGIDFGENKTDQFIRISLTNDEKNILTGLERLINMLYSYHPNPRPV